MKRSETKSDDGKERILRSAASGQFVIVGPRTGSAAATIVRESRAARVASALSQANSATGLLGRGSQSDRSKK